MSDSQNINFGDFGGYTPYDGDGAAALLPFDGYVSVKVKRFKTVMTKGDSPKPMVKLTLKVADQDLPQHTIYAQAFTGGKDRNEENLNRQFADVLVSFGLFTAESLQAEASKGTVKTVDELVNEIITRDLTGFVEIQADTYQGKTSSKVNNFVTRAVFEREVNGGTHRKPHGLSAGGASQSNGASQQAASGMLSGVI
jgi:hypothetical protein